MPSHQDAYTQWANKSKCWGGCRKKLKCLYITSDTKITQAPMETV